MAQCLLHHGWLVLLKTGACCGLPIFLEVTTNWRAGCQKFACPVRREGRSESSSLPLSCHVLRKTRRNVPRHQGFFAEMQSIHPHSGSNPRVLCLTNGLFWTAVHQTMRPWACFGFTLLTKGLRKRKRREPRPAFADRGS